MKGNQRRSLIVLTLVGAFCISILSFPRISEPRGEGRPEESVAPPLVGDQSPQAIEKRKKIRERIELAPCVKDHEHLGTHDGQEAGFVCEACHDAIMGVHEQAWRPSTPVFKGVPTAGCT